MPADVEPRFTANDLTGLELAESIEADARARLAAGEPVDLAMYVDAVANLNAEPTALDAAIDMAIRGLVKSGMTRPQAAQHLAEAYPHFRDAIDVALELDHALWSTTSINQFFDHSRAPRELPSFFGPQLSDGRGRYELRQLLGAGSFGQVYLARDRQLSDDEHDALVSVKILSSQAPPSEWQHWLSDEATKARRVRHRNVVSVLDRDTSADGEPYIVYEFVDGGDLREYVESRGERLTPREAARLVAGIAEGAHAAHMAGLVHCDLKPSNVVLTADHQPKVADFGVARRLRASTSDSDTPTDDRIGNPAFMSPEQYRMEPASLTIPTDIYALGGMLYWLVTGRYPNGDSPTEIARRHAPEAREQATAPSICDVLPQADPTLDRICRRALSPSPEDRHDSAQALANDLHRWLNHQPIEWMHVSPLRRARLWMKRRPVDAIGTFSVLASIIIAAAFAQSAAIKQKRIEVDTELRTEYLGLLESFSSSFDTMEQEGLYDWLFRDIWFSRWLYEPGPWLDPGNLAHEVDRMRTRTVAEQVERLREHSDPASMRVLMWEGCLAFWYVHEQRWDEALAVIETTIPKTQQVLSSDDPWHGHLAALRAIAHFRGSTGLSDAQLRDIEQALLPAEQDLSRTARWSPMHLLVLRSLADLYDANGLDEPDKMAAHRAALHAAEEADTF